MSRTSSKRQAVAATDSLLGLLLTVVGLLILAGGVLDVMPSPFALAGAAVLIGLFTIGGAFVGRTQAGFWAELVPGVLLLVLGILLVRHPPTDAASLALPVTFLFLANGGIRLGAAWEFPSLSTTFFVAGAASIVLALLLILEVRPVTTSGVALLVGMELVVTGVTAMIVSRADHPSKRS